MAGALFFGASAYIVLPRGQKVKEKGSLPFPFVTGTYNIVDPAGEADLRRPPSRYRTGSAPSKSKKGVFFMPHTSVNRTGRIVLRPVAPAPRPKLTVCFPVRHSTARVDGRATLEHWLDLWMANEVEPCRAATTINGYNGIIKNHVVPALGEVPLSELTPDLLRGYYQWLERERGLSPNTVRKHHVLLHTALKAAFQRGIIELNLDKLLPIGWSNF